MNRSTPTEQGLPIGWCHASADHAGHVYTYMGVDHWCRGSKAGRPPLIATVRLWLATMFLPAGYAIWTFGPSSQLDEIVVAKEWR